jgi:hypothetical protein
MVSERNDFEFQIHAALKPTSEARKRPPRFCEHVGDTPAPKMNRKLSPVAFRVFSRDRLGFVQREAPYSSFAMQAPGN